MAKARRGQSGFTLLEIVVVLAVIGALAAMLAPVVFRYIDDGKKAQAQNDANTIAAAVQQMYKDTGRWPFYDNGQGKLSRTGNVDATHLTSNNNCNSATPQAMSCDDTAPVTGANWGDFSILKVDSLAGQLIENDPGYATTGPRAWKGPYLDRIPQQDPWGRSYLVNIGNADPAAEGPSQPWVVVLSAGPDGIVNTQHGGAATTNPTVGGDDVIARVK